MTNSRPGKYCVYVVRCARGTYYTGCTNDLNRRLKTHNAGAGAKCLRGRLPVTLVYAKICRDYANAARDERRIKQLSRKQKEALLSGLSG